MGNIFINVIIVYKIFFIFVIKKLNRDFIENIKFNIKNRDKGYFFNWEN